LISAIANSEKNGFPAEKHLACGYATADRLGRGDGGGVRLHSGAGVTSDARRQRQVPAVPLSESTVRLQVGGSVLETVLLLYEFREGGLGAGEFRHGSR
jgi:hypothetical protein